ncbi:MAG: NADH-quinone oxidoreductase subunit NuoG, partial [Methylophilales bacterium]|nr:NADH-quinone oxidoreductase subunit NuoG [Methylophilales bacterium]
MLKIEIDGKEFEAKAGTTIIEVADREGIPIPRFCYHKKLTVAANCRMCLVQIEKFGKPLPACATPVTDGMKIFTRSEFAVKAQKSVMEFLLINHPLDCPICDQGGECELQDIAVGYGGGASRYTEEKRVVLNKNIGPLISTDMTRCIQCTRCVRFLKEVGGMMELGMVGRGEHAEITAYVDKSVDSELSGNIIDLCPVGALTSKPFRYSARTWELTRRQGIAPHDGLGSPIEYHIKDNKVMRVLPREEEGVNECWISDRDRFSYEGLSSPERLTKPMIKDNGNWVETDWQTALEFAASRIKEITSNNPQELGVLVSPNSTMEEGYLAKKLAQGLSCGNVDHRLRQADFALDGKHLGTPWLGCTIADFAEIERVLVVGSNLRNEHPLLTHRLRHVVRNGAEVSLINALDDDPLMPITNKLIGAPSELVSLLAQVLKALADLPKITRKLPDALDLSKIKPSISAEKIAESLAGFGQRVCVLEPRAGVFLGNMAQHHPRYAEIYSLAQAIATLSGASFGVLSEAANSVGANLADVLPEAGALNARTMLEETRKAYLLVNVEPELDCHNAHLATAAMAKAECVVALTAFKSEALRDADVLLPIAPFSETSGTFMSMEGRMQAFTAAVKPLGECRPAWKVLRVMGNLLGVSGFDFDSSEQVSREMLNGKDAANCLNNQLSELPAINLQAASDSALQRVGEILLYQSDAIVRRAVPLQKTKHGGVLSAAMHGEQLQKLGLSAGTEVKLSQGNGSSHFKVSQDDR